jgi:hypothetical protein
MDLLLYCITWVDDSVAIPRNGVKEASLEELEYSGLRCIFSRGQDLNELTAALPDSALQFHGVVQHMFRQVAVIPFRFPTLVRDRAELEAHLQTNEQKYRESLARLQNLAQMEIRISRAKPDVEAENDIRKQSGTDYLRERQKRQALLDATTETLKRAGSPWLKGWRVRQQADKIRCFALLHRGEKQSFEEALAGITVPADLKVRVTGPWPATEFLDP